MFCQTYMGQWLQTQNFKQVYAAALRTFLPAGIGNSKARVTNCKVRQYGNTGLAVLRWEPWKVLLHLKALGPDIIQQERVQFRSAWRQTFSFGNCKARVTNCKAKKYGNAGLAGLKWELWKVLFHLKALGPDIIQQERVHWEISLTSNHFFSASPKNLIGKGN